MILKIIFFMLRSMLLLIDKMFNVLLLGSPHRTISMRLSFAIYCQFVDPKYSWMHPAADFIDFLFHNPLYSIEEEHIYNSYEADEILPHSFWSWYEVRHKKEYDLLIREVQDIRFRGRC